MSFDALVGRLSLRPGSATPIVCQRPMIGADMMRRLTEGRRASLLPDLVGAVFTLCASAQRATARRAVRAAFGLAEPPADAARDALVLALTTAREHLQRCALDLPTLLPQPGLVPDAGWMRDAPVRALPARADGPARDALATAAAALPGWLERRFFGLPPARWLEAWQADADGWLQHWSCTHEHPFARWLLAVRDDARAFTLPGRALGLVAEGEPGWCAFAADLAADPQRAERPLWHGLPAESGAWTRAAAPQAVPTLWHRLGARLADLARLALHPHDAPLAAGALTLAPGEGIAWSEMSRGLLVHWVRLEAGPQAVDVARAELYRVIAPTEWNFHPDGALARALAVPGMDAARARLAAAVMDPCLPVDLAAEVRDA